MNNRTIQLSALALGIAGALAFGQAHASGFQLKENSVKAMGRAFAGSGVATGDASVVVNNPATMTSFEGTTFQADVTVIDLTASFDGGGTVATGTGLQAPITGGDGGNAGGVTPVPAMSLIHKFDNGVAVGAMVSAPFGLKTEYNDGWVGRYQALTSDLKTVDLTLSAAYEIVPDRFSVGVGLIYERAEAELSKAVDFGSALAFSSVPGFAPQSADGKAVIKGDDNNFGWLIGLNWRPTDSLAIGLTHRSEIDHNLQGTADWTVPGNARTVLNGIGRSNLFQDGGGSAKLTTPSVTSVSLAWQATDRLALMGEYARTDWSSLREVRIDFANPDPDSVEDFSWEASSFYSIGAEFAINDDLTLRGGFAYDETPTSIATRTPRLPDENRRWFSIGLGWDLSESFEINAAYTRIEPDTPKVDIFDASTRHTLQGEYSSDVNLFGLSAQYRF